ncbi:hypothetical protein [Neisseria lactamica]|uniref:hypothetical protein n=1 Tax=Neisseria lactamica TaxID=486 RepID=UPI0024B254DE|nr:hypothetical protein [Neisseria lactamica]
MIIARFAYAFKKRAEEGGGGSGRGRGFDLRAKPAIIPFEIKCYRLCAGLLIAFVYELAPPVLPIWGCRFFSLCFLTVFGFCSGGKVKSGRFDADGKCIRPIHPDGA